MKVSKVSVESFDGRSRLRWRYRGRRKSLSIGLPDNPTNRIYAERLASTIQLDILSGNFDESLNKYRGDRQDKEAVHKVVMASLKRRIKRKYNDSDRALLSHLESYGKPVGSPVDADRFYRWLKCKTTSNGEPLAGSTLNRYLAILKVVDPATFGHIKPEKVVREGDRPFNKSEVRRILAYFEQEIPHWHDYVMFLFYCGTRTSEEIGLSWCDVDLEAGKVTVAGSLKRNRGSSSRRIRGPQRRAERGRYRYTLW